MSLVFGEIIKLDGTKAKLKLYDFDCLESIWVHIPQLCTYKDKSFSGYEIGSEVAAILNDDNTDGVILGGIYNDEDVAVTTDGNVKKITFSDESTISYDKKNHTFLMDIKGDVNIKSENTLVLDCDVKITKSLEVEEDVSDEKGSMQQIRETFNSHTHSNGNNGANTGSPNEEMH